MASSFLKQYVYPIAALTGSIIGVGFLSLPYITLKVGIWPMLFYFIALTTIVTYLHIIFGKISLKTPDHKRFAGFADFYLGKEAKALALALMILGSFGVLLAYVIVGGQLLTAMLQPVVGGNLSWYVFLYGAALSVVIFFGIKTISRLEFWALLLLLVALGTIFLQEYSRMPLANIFVSGVWPGFYQSVNNMFLPYGAIMFSLWGIGMISDVEEMLEGNKKNFIKIIIISTVIPAVIYFSFILLVLGISGPTTTDSALAGLKGFLSPGMFPVALFIGILTTFTAFITQGLLLKETLIYDMGMGELWAWAVTCITPLVLFFLGFNSFISLISFIGGVVLGIDGILILLMYKKIGGSNRVIYPLGVVFILGILYELVYLLR